MSKNIFSNHILYYFSVWQRPKEERRSKDKLKCLLTSLHILLSSSSSSSTKSKGNIIYAGRTWERESIWLLITSSSFLFAQPGKNEGTFFLRSLLNGHFSLIFILLFASMYILLLLVFERYSKLFYYWKVQ